jgi:hypothetical protein
MTEGFLAICTLLCGFVFGWVAAHDEVAKECDKLGKFYIGDTVYECKAVSKKDGEK